MKYEKKIDMSFENTMTIMLSMIHDESVILEFGPASGRLTQFLKTKKQCKMYIVEIDEEAGEIASQYAEDSIIGDILDYEWETKFSNISFDYIIFADVLEHLSDPEEVLRRSRMMLKADGKMIISIPNIAHNSVIIDLLQNKFEYQNTGILDDTHVNFWTYDSFCKLLNKAELYVEERYATYSQVGLNEFKNSYSDLPESVAVYLKTRDCGELYQHVLLASKQKMDNPRNYLKEKRDYYYSQIFFDYGSYVEESENLKTNIYETGKVYCFEFPISYACNKIRIDPLNTACLVYISCKGKKDEDDEFVSIEIESCNAKYYDKNMFWFDTTDAQVYYNVKELTNVQIQMEICEFNISPNSLDQLIKERKIVEQKENYIVEQRKLMKEKEDELEKQRRVIEEKEDELGEQRKLVEEKEDELGEQRKLVEEKKDELGKRDLQIKELETQVMNYEKFVSSGIAHVLYHFFQKRKNV